MDRRKKAIRIYEIMGNEGLNAEATTVHILAQIFGMYEAKLVHDSNLQVKLDINSVWNAL
jgi:hypothetical protein